MIQTVQRRIAFWCMPMVKNDIFLLPNGLKVGQACDIRSWVLLLKSEMHLPWAKFLLVHLFITLNCIPDRVVHWHEAPVHMLSLPPVMESMQLSNCLRVKPG